MSLPFALIVPGCPPITNFQLTNNIFHTDLLNPQQIPYICVTLTSALPQNHALSLSFAFPPYEGMQYVGAVWNMKPSNIFATGFCLNLDIKNHASLKLCLQVQPFHQLTDLAQITDGKKEYSKLVAQNLYNFMMSYNRENLLVNNCNGEYLVVPVNCLERWLIKFQEKYKRDPDFIMKTTPE